MAATMHNPDDKRQPEMPAGDDAPMPAWVGPVKVAVVVMSILIMLGLALLAYGLATGVSNRLAAPSGEISFQHPAGVDLAGASIGDDGRLVLQFTAEDGKKEIIVLDLDGEKIIARISILPGQGYGFIAP